MLLQSISALMLWVVCISLRTNKADGSPHCLGDFPQEEAAGRAYDKYALQHLGKEAVRNFPPQHLHW